MGNVSTSIYLCGLMRGLCCGAKRGIIMLVSRCSSPLLSIIRRRESLPVLHGIVHGFCDPLGSLSPCLHFIFLANVAGFSRLDVFSRLGGVSGVSVSRRCTAVYNVARRRVLARVGPNVSTLTGRRRVACRRTIRDLGHACSNCRFA